MASIKCGNCGETHGSVAEVKACYGPHGSVGSAAPTYDAPPVHHEPATAKQRSYIEALVNERCDGKYPSHMTGTPTKDEASDWIKELLAKPKTRTIGGVPLSKRETPVDGIYKVSDTNEIYKVYQSRHGNSLVKRLDYAHGQETGTFHYIGRADIHLPERAVRLSLDEAKEFGKIYGFCIRCGRTLTDETSIAEGIGPICSGKEWS